MRRPIKALGITLVALLLALPIAPAFAGTYVLDEANVLDAATERRIEELSATVESSTPGAEIAVVTVKSLDGLEIEEYAEERFEQLGVGSKELDNGILLLVAPTERKVRIEVGYGLEGAIPDARAGRIIDDIIIPAFKAGDMADGIERGHTEIAALVLKEYEAEVAGVQEQKSANGWMFLLWLLLGGAGFVALMVWMGKMGWLKNTGGGGGSSWSPPTGGSTWGGGSGDSSGGSSGGGGFGGGDSGGGGASGGW